MACFARHRQIAVALRGTFGVGVRLYNTLRPEDPDSYHVCFSALV
jgi:hypothetical protein